MGCPSCGRGFHDECGTGTWRSPEGEAEVAVFGMDPILDSCCCKSRLGENQQNFSGKGSSNNTNGFSGSSGLDDAGNNGDETAPRGRPPKDDATLIDPHSSWRKRASVEFPLNRTAACEWRGLADVGGGKYPIVGCANGLQQAIHHGPVKITAGFEIDGTPFDFNRQGNIHRLCARCHNLWHHWNDAPYDPADYALRAHAPRPAIPGELLKWATPKTRPQAPEPKVGKDFVKADD